MPQILESIFTSVSQSPFSVQHFKAEKDARTVKRAEIAVHTLTRDLFPG